MMRSLAALLAVAVVACSSDHATTAPPPPPAQPITRLVLADTSALVFTGSSIPGAAFIAHAYDATGAEVADPILTLSAGTGWTVRGDTLIAPTTEGRTTLRVSAKRAAAPASSDLVHFDVVGADSVATDSMEVTAGIDLRGSSWTVSYTCRFRQPSAVHDDSGIAIDSVAAAGAIVDSVVYPGDTSWVPNYGGIAQVWFSGTVQQWKHDSTSDAVAFSNVHMELGLQAPDTLFWYGAASNPATGVPLYPAAMVDSAPRRYMEPGGFASVTICADHDPTRPDTLWFAKVP